MERGGTWTVDLFAEGEPVTELKGDWPEPARFPLNRDHLHVEDVVLHDLKTSAEPLIITGFSALDRLIDFVAETQSEGPVRIVLGSEPFPSRRETYEVRGAAFTREMADYWLNRGISILLSAKLIACIEKLEAHQTLVRYVSTGHRLHAKIYIGDNAATLGSSNFTNPGFHAQLEANARFDRQRDKSRYQETQRIGENYWDMGRDFNDQLIDLLNQLLRLVPWQEALARAAAEVLEGEWAQQYLRGEYLPGDSTLWPSQRQGIAQALYILENQGSVLIADATGSGKTRMGVHLVGAKFDEILRANRLRHGKCMMICPPAVQENWRQESTFAGVHIDIHSHGSLSHGKSSGHDIIIEGLRRAQLLCVDEGHNFLNLGSNRTQQLLRNMADHVMLFTATPINRGVVDLLRIVDMLGADNLDEPTLKAFEKMLGVRSLKRSLTKDELRLLQDEIKKFTVRRTKRVLNELIDKEPAAYLDSQGRQCRFPKHDAKTYSLNETNNDRAIAGQIRELAGQLNAATHFRSEIYLPDALKRVGVTEDVYLDSRLRGAKKLAQYVIMRSLRSSRAALIEHLCGTVAAAREFELKNFQKNTDTGDVIGLLERIAGHPPKSRLSIPLPDWLSDPQAHLEACHVDRDIYQKIYRLVQEMSDHRENRKAEQLARLAEHYNLILAFDSRPITLALIRKLLRARCPAEVKIAIATGDAASQRSDVLKIFGTPGITGRWIGLCSDSLSEGVNLQQAQVVVHLDMPSVVRIAEQRVGRVDRLDSPHKKIYAFWPNDAEEFALTSDARFIERYETVESLLGSNMPLPEDMLEAAPTPLRTEEVIKAFEQETSREPWDGIEDAFAPVRALVSGDGAIVPSDVYEHYRKITARVLSRVSLVAAESPWAFFCSAGPSGVPRWIMLPNRMGSPITNLANVCEELRLRLFGEIVDLKMNEKGAKYLDEFLTQLSRAERSFLPRRKQRAIEELEIVLKSYLKAAAKDQRSDEVQMYDGILRMLKTPNAQRQPDWHEVAARWLDIIRPAWYERLRSKRKRPLVLKDIRSDIVNAEIKYGPLIIKHYGHSFPCQPPPDERIIACIIGVDG
jgi:hypothetical protein